MIVQPATPDGLACAITLAEHQALAAQLAANFGNAVFGRLRPRSEMLFAVAHHDSGWAEIDAAPPGDAQSQLPCSLGYHPLPQLLAAARRSIALNERHHPYCGLLVSMHQAGLYNGRYGLNGAAMFTLAQPAPVLAFLAGEKLRQKRLRRELAADPAWREYARKHDVLNNYLRLQLFDRLALHLNLGRLGHLRPSVIDRVPGVHRRRFDIALTQEIDGVTLAPFPFRDDFTVSYSARLLAPQAGPVDWAAQLRAAPSLVHCFHLRSHIA